MKTLENKLLEAIDDPFTEVRVIREDSWQLLFEITHMYSAYEGDYDKALENSRLQAIAESFGYLHFDIYDDISEGGCETCDYYSRYGKAIRFWR